MKPDDPASWPQHMREHYEERLAIVLESIPDLQNPETRIAAYVWKIYTKQTAANNPKRLPAND